MKSFFYMGGRNVFWRNKKDECKHTWHHLQDTFITNNCGGVIDIDDACYIFCPWCKTEKLVYKEEWERIKKKQEIIKELSQSIYE